MEPKILTNKVYHCDNIELLKRIPDNKLDMIAADPPYGMKLMGVSWDKVLPSKEAFLEMFRVLKPGAFCFVFSSPRQDLLYRMTRLIEDAGFMIDFPSIYWTYATGIGLGANVSKMIDKRLGVEGEVIKEYTRPNGISVKRVKEGYRKTVTQGGKITAPASDLAKEFDGAYVRYRPKPCLEIIITAMKPVEKVKRSEIWEKHKIDYFETKREKTKTIRKIAINPALNDELWIDGKLVESTPYRDTKLSDYVTATIMNGHACTWLDRCRVPLMGEDTRREVSGLQDKFVGGKLINNYGIENQWKRLDGRYPTNLLVQGDLLDTGECEKSRPAKSIVNGGKSGSGSKKGIFGNKSEASTGYQDSGSYTRYFCFDSWCREKLPKTYPFLPVPKPSASTKVGREAHLTEKPVQIFAYLVTLASRPGDLIGDFYAGSGSSLLAAAGMNRDFIGCDKVAEHVKIAEQRLSVLLVNREKKEITCK